jgi:hypothetical protein
MDIVDFAPSVFALYMLIGSNFLPELMGCRLQTALRTSMLAKHSMGIVLAFFLVVVVNPQFADKHLISCIGATLLIYIWFLMTTRSPFPIMLAAISILLVVYIMDLRKRKLESEGNAKGDVASLRKYMIALCVIAGIISIIGFGIYMVEKSREYKNGFDFVTFLVGRVDCRNFTPNSAKIVSTPSSLQPLS